MQNLYTGLKIFHFQDKLDSLPQDNSEIRPPLHIRIKPTNICNHDCWYCAYRSSNLQLGSNMVEADSIPRDKMMEIIDDIIDMGVKAVTFSGGGEPLVYRHLPETLRKLSDSPVQFASLTNASRLTGEVAELLAFGGTWLRVSIDGWDAASYAEYRGNPLSEFEKVLKNMESFKKLGGPCRLGVSLIIDKKNASHIFDLVGTLKDIGIDSVKFSPCIVSNDAGKNREYHENLFTPVKGQIAKAHKTLQDERFEIYDAYHELAEKFDKNYDWCPFSQILPIIGADLNVYACQDKAYNLDKGLLGSIQERSFKDFWFSEKAQYFKIDPSRDCNHHCVANQKNQKILEYLSADKEHVAFV